MATHPRVFLPGKSMDTGAERAGLQLFMGSQRVKHSKTHAHMLIWDIYKKRIFIFIWNSSLTWHPVFYLTTLLTKPPGAPPSRPAREFSQPGKNWGLGASLSSARFHCHYHCLMTINTPTREALCAKLCVGHSLGMMYGSNVCVSVCVCVCGNVHTSLCGDKVGISSNVHVKIKLLTCSEEIETFTGLWPRKLIPAFFFLREKKLRTTWTFNNREMVPLGNSYTMKCGTDIKNDIMKEYMLTVGKYSWCQKKLIKQIQ